MNFFGLFTQAGRKFAAFLVTLAVLIGGLNISALTNLPESMYSTFVTAAVGTFVTFCGGNVWAKYSKNGKTLLSLKPKEPPKCTTCGHLLENSPVDIKEE